MASTPPKSTGESTPNATFSYAQAAKGIVSGPSTGAHSSTASGSASPKDEVATAGPLSSAPPGANWAEDTNPSNDDNDKESRKASAATPQLPNGASTDAKNTQDESSSTASQDTRLSTATTLKEDSSSARRAESEGTWESKSQTSNPPEKAPGKSENKKDRAKKRGEKKESQKEKTEEEKVPPKPLQEAPLPAVNIWKQRADQAAKSKPVAVKQTASPTSALDGRSNEDVKPGPTKATKSSDESEVATKERKGSTDRIRSDDKVGQGRHKPVGQTRSDAAALALPPKDQDSWPTVEVAQDKEKKRAQEKGEKVDKDRSASAPSTSTGGKKGWVPVPYTPSVVFSTPLPNTNPRRGGRGGGRGGSQAGGRGSYPSNGSASMEKEASGGASTPNGDQPKRGRTEGGVGRDASPKSRRAASAGSVSWREAKSAAGERSLGQGSTVDSRLGNTDDRTSLVTTHSRQHPKSQKQTRKFDASGDRRKDHDVFSSPELGPGSNDRRASTATQTEADSIDRKQPGVPESQGNSSKNGTNERRSGPFGSFSGRDREGRSRGGMRGGRGGGYHAYQNAHHVNGHQYPNGHAAPVSTSTSFPLPRSPTTFYPEQSNAFFPPPAGQHSRGYRNGAPRSQSIPSASGYQGTPQHMAPLQPYVGGLYDYSTMQPIGPAPYAGYVDQIAIMSMASQQLEYYFSVDNLCKDMFLRKHMDSKGFVFLSVIADFNRMKLITTDMELIKMVCYQSRTIEFRVGSDGKDRLRRRDGWEQWVLSMTDRDPSAQNDGPEELYSPTITHPHGLERYSLGPVMAPGSPGSGPHDASFQSLNGVAASPVVTNHANSHPMSPNAPPYYASVPPAKAWSPEADAFPDDQVETLSVIVRNQDAKSPTSAAPNGAINGTAIVEASHKPDSQQGNLQVNGHGPVQGGSRGRSGFPSGSLSEKNTAAYPLRLFWVKGKDTPVDSLPEDSTYEFYTELRSKALDQRRNAASGTCPYDMIVLYQFWSHFLIRNFNSRMYDEFRHLALEDASEKASDLGLKDLIKYYGESLTGTQLIRERIARHYVDLVKSEDPNSDRPAFQQLRAAWRNGALNMKNRKKIGNFMDAELKASLEV